jgi:hypothetical protein
MKSGRIKTVRGVGIPNPKAFASIFFRSERIESERAEGAGGGGATHGLPTRGGTGSGLPHQSSREDSCAVAGFFIHGYAP